ncbi:MAG: hypothetical protein LBR29_10800 [Methylobacteriaceae bacterium]|jgi:hypothetical protein|nr:hypothetical protein [Methylobacteriaceae bacterium]
MSLLEKPLTFLADMLVFYGRASTGFCLLLYAVLAVSLYMFTQSGDILVRVDLIPRPIENYVIVPLEMQYDGQDLTVFIYLDHAVVFFLFALAAGGVLATFYIWWLGNGDLFHTLLLFFIGTCAVYLYYFLVLQDPSAVPGCFRPDAAGPASDMLSAYVRAHAEYENKYRCAAGFGREILYGAIVSGAALVTLYWVVKLVFSLAALFSRGKRPVRHAGDIWDEQ